MDGERMLLHPEDRAILDLECETVVGHTCKVVRLAGAVEVDAVRARLAERLPAVPVLIRRLGGDVSAPEWVPDPGFDVARHVVPVAGPAPLDDAGLRRALALAFAEHLDRDHPLWSIGVATLADGGTALIWRVHHALADGTTLVRWAETLLWDPAESVPLVPARPPVAAPEAAAPLPAVPGVPADELRRRLALAGLVARERAGMAVARERAGFVAREHALSVARSPFDGRIGTRREVGTARLSLSALRSAARGLAGATLNDALLTVLAGALRSYVASRALGLRDVRVRVPVSLHTDGDDVANRDSFFTLALPLHVADPVERLHVIHRATSVRKQQHDAEQEDALLRGSAAVARLLSRANDNPRSFAVSVSNVPGPRRPVRLHGHPVTELIGLAEIGRRHALRVAAVSLADVFSLGFCADPDLVPEVQSMADAATQEAARLVSAAT